MSFVRDAKMSAPKWEILPFNRGREGAPIDIWTLK